ncbi:MAG: nif11-like peptide radical SAM maturase [Proteobacteria bacterium]|nr:nif11-like peptide radical SAM maturase [Pseudomonadota bacterium]
MAAYLIKPYHLFHHQGRSYVINVEGMSASTIDAATAEVLQQITSGEILSLDSGAEDHLKKLGLLVDVSKQPPKVKKDINKDPMPVVNLSLFLTQSCNLKCVYCYGDEGKYGSGGNLDEKTAFQAVDWLLEQSGKIKKLHIGFFGGEPFLNFPMMKTVVEYARNRVQELGKDIEFNTTTNATLLGDEQIAFIKEHKIRVMVSFDGTKELQDAQRPFANGQGSYDNTLPRIKKLLEAVPATPGHAVIVGATDPKIVKDAMQEIGFAEVSVVPASQSLLAGEPDTTQSARDTQETFQSLEQEADTWIDLVGKRDDESLKKLKNKSGLYHALLTLLHNSKQRHACGAGLGLAAVSCAGDIYLCHRFVGRDEYKMGNVFEKGLNREEYLKSPTTESAVCAACFAKYYCAGGCKHDNAGSCGSIATPAEDICRLKCRELELAASIVGRLGIEERAFLVKQDIFPPKPCPLDF